PRSVSSRRTVKALAFQPRHARSPIISRACRGSRGTRPTRRASGRSWTPGSSALGTCRFVSDLTTPPRSTGGASPEPGRASSRRARAQVDGTGPVLQCRAHTLIRRTTMSQPWTYLPSTPSGPLVVDRAFYDRLARETTGRTLVDRFVVPIRSGRAWPVRAGQLCRIVTLEGPQVADFNACHLHDPRDRF